MFTLYSTRNLLTFVFDHMFHHLLHVILGCANYSRVSTFNGGSSSESFFNLFFDYLLYTGI
jgi:hypothetical protein